MRLTLVIFLVGLANLFWLAACGLRMGSTAGMPTRVSRSAIRADFNLTSNGESQPKDGVKFTSSSHGFRQSSIRMSNPNNSIKKKKNNQNNSETLFFYISRHTIISFFSQKSYSPHTIFNSLLFSNCERKLKLNFSNLN